MASLENAGVILRLINSLQRQVTVTDLVEHLAMPKSSASRLLKQMAEEGFLERDAITRAYGPALMVLELSALLDQVRGQRYASALNEALPGVGSVSCAVSDPATRERLAFCLSFPSADADATSIQALARDLVTEASSIGRLVGDPLWAR